MKAINSVDDFINTYNELCQTYGEEDVSAALDIMIGRINNQYVYAYFDEEHLNDVATQCPYFFAIQINDVIYAVPNDIIGGMLCPANVFNSYGHVNHYIISSMCRDLNNILKITNIPINFQSFKININGELQDVYHNFDDDHIKIDIGEFELLIAKIHNYYASNGKIGDRKIEGMIDKLYSNPIYVNGRPCMNFSEYSSLVGSVLGHDLLNRPHVIKPTKFIIEIDENNSYGDMEVVEQNKDGKWEVVELEEVKYEPKIIPPKKYEPKKVEEKEEKKILPKLIPPKKHEPKKVEEKEERKILPKLIPPKKYEPKKVEEKEERKILPKIIPPKKHEPKLIPPKKYEPKKVEERKILPKIIPPKK